MHTQTDLDGGDSAAADTQMAQSVSNLRSGQSDVVHHTAVVSVNVTESHSDTAVKSTRDQLVGTEELQRRTSSSSDGAWVSFGSLHDSCIIPVARQYHKVLLVACYSSQWHDDCSHCGYMGAFR